MITYLPSIHAPGAKDVRHVPEALAFADAWFAMLAERARDMHWNARLTYAAQGHADYLAALTVPSNLHLGAEGSSPNERCRKVGYKLPSFWPVKGNQVESVAQGYGSDAARAFHALYNSLGHRVHLMREHFFEHHTVYGIGARDGRYVIVSAPPAEGE